MNISLQLNREKRAGLVTHVLVWFLLIVLPFILQLNAEQPRIALRYWFFIIPLFLVFNANYFLLIPKVYFNRNTAQFVLWNLLLFIILFILVTRLKTFFYEEIGITRSLRVPKRPGSEFINFLFIYSLGLGLAMLTKLSARWRSQKRDLEKLKNENLKSQLSSLRYQLQPHFFFNTLNTIYSQIGTNPGAAQETVLQLSKLMRYVLNKYNEETISVKEELEFIKSYIELMEKRHSSGLEINFQTEDLDPGKRIPPLLLISLVENAFKHGTDGEQNSFINIRISSNSQDLITEIRNSYYPKIDDESGSGIGLENVRKRLLMRYAGTNYRFISEHREKEYYTYLLIPYC